MQLSLTEEEIDYLAHWVGSVTAAAVGAIITAAAVGLTMTVLVRAIRAWSDNDCAARSTARNAAVLALLGGFSLELWSARVSASFRTHPLIVAVDLAAILLLPLFLLAWALGAYVRRRNAHDPSRR